MTEETNIDTNDTGIEADDLADFSASLFNAEKPAESVSTPEASEGAEDEHTSHEADESEFTNEDHQDTGNDEGESEDDPEAEAKSDADSQKGKKKSRFQERIDDLTGKLREGDRQRDDLAAQLQVAITKLEELSGTKPAETPQNTQKTQTDLVEPTADDVNEDGSPKYPLGEFDPKLMRDLTRYDRAVERARETEVADQAKAEQAQQAELQALQNSWNEKVTSAKDVYPDYVEKGEALLADLSDIPQDTAIFLTTNIMGMEYGPDVFYYLAEHPEEARVIAKSNPATALTRLGRIEARFEMAAQERSGKETKLRTSKAPEPAPQNKGSNAAPPSIDVDTADLADFEKMFFKKR